MTPRPAARAGLRALRSGALAALACVLGLSLAGHALSLAASPAPRAPSVSPPASPVPATLPAARPVSTSTRDSLAQMLPEGKVTAEILTPDYPPRVQEVIRKLDNARQANPRFFQAWIAQHPGGPPPWNPALGVTRDEYEDYLREGRNAPFAVRTRVELTFLRDPHARRWTLHGWGLLTPLEGVTIDVDHDAVTSPRWGRLPFLGTSAPNEPGVQLPWRWYGVWKASHQSGDPRKGGQALQASMHIGPLGDGNMTCMYWVARRFNGGQKLADEFLLLRFPRRR